MIKSLAIFAALGLAGVGTGVGVMTHHNSSVSETEIKPISDIPSPYDGCNDCTMPARQIAWSFDHQPKEWSSDRFRAHRRGVWIWIANEDYGIEVGTDASTDPEGFGWKPSAQDRLIIYAAFSRWKYSVSLHASDIHP